MKLWTKLLTVALLLILFSAFLIGSIRVNSFNPMFFKSQYIKMATAENIGIGEDDLLTATNVLLDYLQDKRDNIDFAAVINEENREVFNEKEKTHMVDVKNLYNNAMLYGKLAFAVSLIALLILIILKQVTLKGLIKSYLWGIGLFLFVIASLVVWSLIDFTSFWNCFHMLIFDNNLWILNPQTDILLMMVPEEFFFSLVMLIAAIFIVMMLLPLIIMLIMQKRGKEKRTEIFYIRN